MLLKIKLLSYLFLLSSLTCFTSCFHSSWQNASRDTTGIAPLAEKYKESVVQIYAAKLFGFKGLIADHTWISTKKEGAHFYKVYEVLGWLRYSNSAKSDLSTILYDLFGWSKYPKETNSVLRIAKDIPDKLWYGNKPRILLDLRGNKAKKVIHKIHQAAISYPYKKNYSLIGPNSNTFTAWVACKVPELNLHLSYRAIGKNYLKTCQSK